MAEASSGRGADECSDKMMASGGAAVVDVVGRCSCDAGDDDDDGVVGQRCDLCEGIVDDDDAGCSVWPPLSTGGEFMLLSQSPTAMTTLLSLRGERRCVGVGRLDLASDDDENATPSSTRTSFSMGSDIVDVASSEHSSALDAVGFGAVSSQLALTASASGRQQCKQPDGEGVHAATTTAPPKMPKVLHGTCMTHAMSR